MLFLYFQGVTAELGLPTEVHDVDPLPDTTDFLRVVNDRCTDNCGHSDASICANPRAADDPNQPFVDFEFFAEMKLPSRRMPPYVRPPMSFFGWLIVGVWVVAVAYLLWLFPWGIAIIVGLVVLSWFGTRTHNEKLAALIQDRGGDSICEFARSFDAKVVDTWVIRAVYEALQAETEVNGKSVPIRADDSLTDDLQIDDEDLDMSIAETIAQRCGRSLDEFDENPLIGKVKTAGDLVMFFNAQPLESNASGT